MSISYEEALSTLTSMFGPPWTLETLDAVLRHHNGHMENTVDSVLRHGDGDPQVLVEQLKSGVTPGSTDLSLDEELARQLSREERSRVGQQQPRSPAAAAPKPKGRGTNTTLPPDFLRIPRAGAVQDDEALARMLQDELFSQELANNPEFAHLARGRPRTVGGRPTHQPHQNQRGRISDGPSRASGFPANQNQRRGQVDEGPNILDKISEMGENAKKRLSVFAAQWNADNRNGVRNGQSDAHGGSAAQERRGLLDDDDAHEGPQEMEMTFSGGATKKDS